MMKMLFLTPQFPYPLDNGGKKGCYNGLQIVDDLFDVTVLSFCEDNRAQEGLNYLNRKFHTIRFVQPVKHRIHIRKNIIKLSKVLINDFFSGIPYLTNKFINKKMVDLICKCFDSNDYFDYVFIDYFNMGYYFDFIEKKYKNKFGKIIFKDHNIENKLIKQEYNISKGIIKKILQREWKITEQYEISLIKKANICYSVCNENRDYLRQYNKKSYSMLPIYEVKNERTSLSEEPNMFYFGNLSWRQNYEGLIWFIEKVFPIIKTNVSNAKLIIAGSGLNDNPFEKYGDDIQYLGYIDDISHIYDDKKVFVVPLKEGSGIRIKILDAFNNDIAVVSTSIGCETIGAVNGKHIMIADDDVGFAEKVMQLFDSNINNRIRKAAKDFLREEFSIEKRKLEFIKSLELK